MILSDTRPEAHLKLTFNLYLTKRIYYSYLKPGLKAFWGEIVVAERTCEERDSEKENDC